MTYLAIYKIFKDLRRPLRVELKVSTINDRVSKSLNLKAFLQPAGENVKQIVFLISARNI